MACRWAAIERECGLMFDTRDDDRLLARTKVLSAMGD